MVEINETNKNLQDTGTSNLSKAREANWPAVLFFIHIHLLSLYGIWTLLFTAKITTIIFLITLVMLAILGVTTGAHRLWAHNTYKASTGLRIVLIICQTLVGQGSVYSWVQYHRLHHAQFGTDGDPYDHNKGFFYAHILTRLKKLSPYQEKLLRDIDMSDLENDSVVMFQKRFYWIMYAIIFLLVPLNAPLEYWNDTVLSSVFVIGWLRYGIVLNAAWLIESAICVWGLKLGDKYPSDTNAVFVINKTFWPHYHYLIPYDYKSGEYGTYDCGCSSAFIRVWAALGLATQLRTIDTRAVQKALADAVRSQRPLNTCLEEAIAQQQLPDDHFLIRGER